MPLQTLQIALTDQRVMTEQLPAEVEQRFLGGRGAAVWLLAQRVPPTIGPLAPANLLIFSAGPLAGVTFSGFTVTTRSPITNSISHGWASGRWGSHLRRAGHDLLVLEGQSLSGVGFRSMVRRWIFDRRRTSSASTRRRRTRRCARNLAMSMRCSVSDRQERRGFRIAPLLPRAHLLLNRRGPARSWRANV